MNGDDLIFTKGSLNVAQGRKYAIPSETELTTQRLVI